MFLVFDAAVILVVLGLYVLQRSLLFPVVVQPLPDLLPPDVQRIEVDGQYALYLSPDLPPDLPPDLTPDLPPRSEVNTAAPAREEHALIIFFHGNAEVAWWSVESFGSLRRAGIGIVLMEYPGYGGNPGHPSAQAITSSALSLFDEVSGWSSVGDVYVFGRSIGGGVATAVAAQRPVAGVILASTFTSLHELVYEKWLPAFLLRDRFDSRSIVETLTVPVLVYHGRHDRLIPFGHGERLAAAAGDGSLKAFDCGHNNCPIPTSTILSWIRDSSGEAMAATMRQDNVR